MAKSVNPHVPLTAEEMARGVDRPRLLTRGNRRITQPEPTPKEKLERTIASLNARLGRRSPRGGGDTKNNHHRTHGMKRWVPGSAA